MIGTLHQQARFARASNAAICRRNNAVFFLHTSGIIDSRFSTCIKTTRTALRALRLAALREERGRTLAGNGEHDR
ncbi:MAG: hypothetical protein ABI190_06685 [Casimicrobiaceae bacterium]